MEEASTVSAARGVDTGRLRTGLNAEAHRIVYDQYLPPVDGAEHCGGLIEELGFISEVDRAHLVMLVERGIVDAAPVAALLRAIDALRADGFAPVQARPMPRGVYLAYESHLVAELGDDVGGVLHTGRSRNDLNATTARLRARRHAGSLLEAVRHLATVLLDRAAAYRTVTMPAYTHGQPAVPITYGHYLTGVASAVVRGLRDLLDAARELDVNPLGAGAVGGTSVPVDPVRTGELLGFATAARNSVDAVASRDFGLRLLSAAGVLGVVAARVARDLTFWTVEENPLLRLADDLVGSSSMMPQKRNPFLLEHIQGRATASLGAFTAAASAMVTAPYTNAIAVTGDALRHVWPGMRATVDVVVLLRLVVAGAEPDAHRMLRRAVDGYTSATYLAERLVATGVPFRTAHHLVGRAVADALEAGAPLAAAAAAPEIAAAAPDDGDANWLSPTAVAAACAYGAGPGGDSTERAIGELHGELDALSAELTGRTRRWAEGAALLDAAARAAAA
ncbi:lyase family protein [Plantactinospora sp. CA-290183]|uniref:lyase family protein n=1 Tax=Plantactinospora sp. CA-290183 TaxID=3240006 RepID=UPI003D8A49D4